MIRKLKLIEALHKGATTPGEQLAAAAAKERLKGRLQDVLKQAEEKPEPYRFSVPDEWRRKLLLALLRRHGVQPYQLYRQRDTTVRAEVSKKFVDEILWPEYQEMSKELAKYLAQVTDRIISSAIWRDASNEKIMDK